MGGSGEERWRGLGKGLAKPKANRAGSCLPFLAKHPSCSGTGGEAGLNRHTRPSGRKLPVRRGNVTLDLSPRGSLLPPQCLLHPLTPPGFAAPLGTAAALANRGHDMASI